MTAGRYEGKKISRKEMFDEEDEENFLKLNPNLYEIVDEDDDDVDEEEEEEDLDSEHGTNGTWERLREKPFPLRNQDSLK